MLRHLLQTNSHSLSVLLLLIVPGLLSLSAEPSAARGWDCEALCERTREFQGYGTGAEDPVCVAQCRQGGERRCEGAWQDLFLCLDEERSAESCRGLFEEAKICSACTAGEVDSEGMEKLLFVDKDQCQPGASSGAFGDPFCKVHEGIDEAMDLQSQGVDTKVFVCPATYREGQPVIGPITAPGGNARIIVESVVADEAIVSGSEDVSGIWEKFEEEIVETVYNEFTASRDLTMPAWVPVGVGASLQIIPDPPLFLPQGPTKVTTITAQSAAPYIQQAPAPIDDRLVTLSAYIRPGTADRFMLEIIRQQGGGTLYGFELPPTGSCAYEKTNSTIDGYGIEDAGNGWYRVYLTQVIDNDPTSPPAPNPVTFGRIRLVDVAQGDDAEIYGMQLDHKPLDRFSVTPRVFLETDLQPAQQVVTRTETLFAAKPWTHDWGLTAHDPGWGGLPPLFRRAEMIFVDGDPLAQELHLADMKPGSFWIDDGIAYGGFNHKQTTSRVPGSCSAEAPCPIYILPTSEQDLNEDPVEIAERAQLLWIGQLQDAEIRGLRFQHATAAYDSAEAGCALDLSTCPSSVVPAAVSFTNSKHLTLRENRYVHNAAFGYSVGGLGSQQDAEILLVGNSTSDNGIGGAGVGATRSLVVVGEELARNNTRGRRSLVSGHSTTGAKYGGVSHAFLSGLVVRDNYATGLWFDYENHGIEITDSLFSNNAGAGLYFEANDIAPQPSSTNFVLGSEFVGNEVGVQMIGSRNTRIDSNRFERNDVALSLNGNPWTPPPPAPQKWLRDLYVTYNVFNATCPSQLWYQYGDANWPIYDRWQPVMESMLSDYNEFSHVDGSAAPGFSLPGLGLSLSAWHGCSSESWCFLPQDRNSVFVP